MYMNCLDQELIENCTKCGNISSILDFYQNKNNKVGYLNENKLCSTEYWIKNPEKSLGKPFFNSSKKKSRFIVKTFHEKEKAMIVFID